MIKKMIMSTLLVAILIASASSSVVAREYGDVYMDSTRDSMMKSDVGAVVFPHWFHRIRYKCKVCHENIFIMKKGANNISMRRIMEGEACGTCHNGQIAWEALYCDRCHSASLDEGEANR